MTKPSYAQMIAEKAVFSEHEAWRRCGYDDEREPGVKHIIDGARGESLTLLPLITAQAVLIEELVKALEIYSKPAKTLRDNGFGQRFPELFIPELYLGEAAKEALQKFQKHMESLK